MNGKHAEEGRLYDRLARGYDLLAPPERIRKEIDALEPHLRSAGAQRVLDAGCGTGPHVRELLRRGFRVDGIDRSAGMLREARRRTKQEGLRARFAVHDLTDSGPIPWGPYDAIVCLGNTAASFHSERERVRAMISFQRALREAGLLVLQFRDISRIKRTGHVFPTRSLRRDGEEWILLRRQEPVPGGMRFFATLLYRPDPETEWETHHSTSVVPVVGALAWRRDLRAAGFRSIETAVDLRGTPRRRGDGPDLVLFGRKR